MLRKNVASQYLYFALVNATTGAALTGATVTGKRAIDGAAQASVTGTISEEAGGQYKLALSQADINGNNIGFLFTATNAIPVGFSVVTTAADPTDAVRFGLTSLPNAAAEAAGGLYTRGTGAGQINQPANGNIDANVKTWLSGAIPAVNVTGVPLVDLKYTLGTISPATAGSVRADAVTGAVGSVTAAVTIAAASVQAIWDALTSALTTVGSIGKKLADWTIGTAQTGDAYARLGAPAGASVSADIAAAKVDTAAVKVQTDKLAFTVANQVDSNVLDWKSSAAPAMTGDAFARIGAPAGASVSVDVAAIKSDSAAIKAKTDNLPAAPASTSDIPTANANADALLDRASGVETSWTLRQAMRVMLASLGGKLSGAATSTVAIRDVGDSKDRITATVDASGNRSAVSYDKT